MIVALSACPADWMDLALCRGEDPELFFPVKAGPAPASTRAICERCEVRGQCLEHALALEDGLPRCARFGVWAGTTPHERRLLDLARRRATADPPSDEPDHGTLNRYRNVKCRCADCREAHRAACAEERAHRAEHLEDAPHGLAATYTNWGCRCDECTRANTKACRERSQRRRASA